MKHAGLDSMIALVADKFEGVYDKGGVPYIMHCLTVMNGVQHLGYKAMMIAVGHDLIEDTSVTSTDLTLRGFHPTVVGGIVEMTHLEGESYDDYLYRIKHSLYFRLVIPIKQEDLMHNSQLYRLKGVTDKDLARAAKYAKAYKYLEDMK